MEETYALVRANCVPHETPGCVSVEFLCDDVELYAGVLLGEEITPFIEHVFSNGQCHALALALHEILGWPICGCYRTEGADRSTNHVILLSPDGGTADIHGIRCVDYRTRPIKPETIRRNRMRDFLKPSMELARHYAPMVVKRFEKGRYR